MLSRYKGWAYEQRWNENVETLRKFIIEESEFQIAATEELNGLGKGGQSLGKNRASNSYYGDNQNTKTKNNFQCVVCKENHKIWQCNQFKTKDSEQRWDIARKNKLCYRCLAGKHFAKECRNSRICGIDGCLDTHNRLLHKVKKEPSNAAPTGSNQEGEQSQSSHTTNIDEDSKCVRFISLRTVPVILKNNNRTMVVNALLDDGSTKSYINSSVAAELRLQGVSQNVTVNKLNGQAEILQTTTVEFQLESLDGKVKTKIDALTVKQVTGNLKPINWAAMAKKWKHLKDIDFPNVGPKPVVDILIGVDYAELHCAEKELKDRHKNQLRD